MAYMKGVHKTELDFINNKKYLNRNSLFSLVYYFVVVRTSKRKDINICSILKVLNHLQYLVGF